MKAVVAIGIVAALGCITLYFLSPEKPATTIGQAASDPEQLICITEQRIPVEITQMALCIKPPDIGPHEVPEILIYANPIALEFKRKHPDKIDYPVGSQFVKTKYANRGDHEPSAVTMMFRKASAGDISDWEFTSYSLPDKNSLGPVNDPSCIACHQGFAERGFVSMQTEGALRRHLGLE